MYKKIKHALFLNIPQMIRGEKKSVFTPFILLFLRFLSFGMKLGVFFRNQFYDRGFIKQEKISIPIVSIGNIVAGGSGKTPLTAYLFKRLVKNKRSIGILSRGYGSKFENSHFYIDKNRSHFSWQDVGDEPYFFSKRLKDAKIFIGKDRIYSAKKAEKKGVELLLMDDGGQYRILKRDFEIIMINANDPFGQNHFLPRGFLRDDPSRLKVADLIVINHVKDEKQFDQIKQKLKLYSNAPVVGAYPLCKAIKNAKGELLELSEKQVVAFCSIANPNSFFDLIKKQNINLIDQICFADHEPIDFTKVVKSNFSGYYLCTEKDFVKLSQKILTKYPVAYFAMEYDFPFGKEHLENIIEKINKMMNNASNANKIS